MLKYKKNLKSAASQRGFRKESKGQMQTADDESRAAHEQHASHQYRLRGDG